MTHFERRSSKSAVQRRIWRSLRSLALISCCWCWSVLGVIASAAGVRIWTPMTDEAFSSTGSAMFLFFRVNDLSWLFCTKRKKKDHKRNFKIIIVKKYRPSLPSLKKKKEEWGRLMTQLRKPSGPLIFSLYKWWSKNRRSQKGKEIWKWHMLSFCFVFCILNIHCAKIL